MGSLVIGLIATNVLEDWRERVNNNDEIVPCEIEFWFRAEPTRRQAARDRVIGLINELDGRVLDEVVIDDIAYHAILTSLPVASVQPLLDESGHENGTDPMRTNPVLPRDRADGWNRIEEERETSCRFAVVSRRI